MFLHAIHPACLAAQQRGQDTLEPHCCKAAVVERIVDLHRVLPELLDAMLGSLLAESPDTDRLHYILENSAEFPRMGHRVAQLALSISDPAKDLSRQARVGVYRLYQLLLHQKGLRKVLLGGAEKILIRTAVVAIHDPYCVSARAAPISSGLESVPPEPPPRVAPITGSLGSQGLTSDGDSPGRTDAHGQEKLVMLLAELDPL
ncbi:unnamed protein product [Caretta caretta]